MEMVHQDLKQLIAKRGIFIHQWVITINLSLAIKTIIINFKATVLQGQTKDYIIISWIT